MTEYIIILSLVAVAAITVFSAFGGANRAQVAAVANEIAGNHEAAKKSTQLAQNYANYASDTASYSRDMGNYNSSPDWSNYSGGAGSGTGGSGTGGSGAGGSGAGGSGAGGSGAGGSGTGDSGTGDSGSGGSGSGGSGTGGSGTGGSGSGGSGSGGSGTGDSGSGGSGSGGSGTGGSGTGGSGSGGSGSGGSGTGGSGTGGSGTGDPVIASCGVDKGGYAVAAKGAKPVKIDGTDGEICSQSKKIITTSEKVSDAIEKIRRTTEGAKILNELESNSKILQISINEGGNELGLTKVKDLTPSRSMLDVLLGKDPNYAYAIKITINMEVDDPRLVKVDGTDFIPTLERIVAHELAHAYMFSTGGFIEFRYNQEGVVNIENKIAQELDPNSPIRHPNKGHGGIL